MWSSWGSKSDTEDLKGEEDMWREGGEVMEEESDEGSKMNK